MDDEMLGVLRSIDRRLALLTMTEERDVRKALIGDILTTPARLSMWDAIDGRAGSLELSKAAKVSERAAQLFVKDLLDTGLVSQVANQRGTVVTKDEDAIVHWYMRRSVAAGDTGQT
jgi:hypothetical protein